MGGHRSWATRAESGQTRAPNGQRACFSSLVRSRQHSTKQTISMGARGSARQKRWRSGKALGRRRPGGSGFGLDSAKALALWKSAGLTQARRQRIRSRLDKSAGALEKALGRRRPGGSGFDLDSTKALALWKKRWADAGPAAADSGPIGPNRLGGLSSLSLGRWFGLLGGHSWGN